MSTASSTQPAANAELRDKYVSRLRARLSRPKITIADARDGMLDCYVSTYHAGVEQGLKGILGVNASPDQVAQVATKMFRDRLTQRGVSFEDPTAEALNDIKEELDNEFHFSELPVEVSATHDQVCSLLLAKADGLLEHHGNRSVLANTSSSLPPPPPVTLDPRPAATPAPPAARLVAKPTPAAAPVPTPAAAPATASTATGGTSVGASLRQALAMYLNEVAAAVDTVAPQELLRRIDRAKSLAQSIADFE